MALAAMSRTDRGGWHGLWVAVPALVALVLVSIVSIPPPMEAAMLFALVLMLTLMAWWVGQSRASRSRTMINLLDSLREGDYGVRASAPGRRDDFADIVRSFNELATRLQDEQRGLQEPCSC